MQRKPGFPVANCSIKPDNMNSMAADHLQCEDDVEQQQRRQQLINFGHSQWGFNNWSWTVSKQELDFVDFNNGKYCAGVVAFVSITVKSIDIHRENIGYATSLATNKGLAIYKSRKCAVTNALRETLLSFGGSVATELLELIDSHKADAPVTSAVTSQSEPANENNQNAPNKPAEPKNSPLNRAPRKEEVAANMRPPVLKNPPVAAALPMAGGTPLGPPAAPPHPAGPPAAPPHPAGPSAAPPHSAGPPAALRARAPAPRPNSNVSFVLQPVIPPMYPPRLPPPVAPVFPNYYEYGPWHFAYETYDRHHGNVNLNFNMPPKNLVVNGRAGSVECKNACRQGPEGEALQYAPQQGQGCWIKPTIFYDGFWTEQKVKKWVAEQVEKQFPEDATHKASSPSAGQPDAPKA